MPRGARICSRNQRTGVNLRRDCSETSGQTHQVAGRFVLDFLLLRLQTSDFRLCESMRIQAAVLWEQGQPLSVEAAELDSPGPGEVLVEIKAAGVCHSDLHPARGDWPIKTPLVLGHEGAGIVREVGPSVTKVRPGDHVVLCWAPACGVCPPCREGRSVLCDRAEKTNYRNRLPSGAARLHARDRDVAPFLGTACFADAGVVAEDGAIPVPRGGPVR